jgi:hypothetical protein
MSDHQAPEDLAFAERFLRAYRETGAPAPEARRRILAAIRGRHVRHAGALPWLQPRIVAVRPVAVAASGLALIALGAVAAWQLARLSPPHGTVTVEARLDADPHAIRFVLADPTASRVALVGDFNGWDETATPLAAGPVDGYWSVTVTLPAGWHSYAFVVDGTRWLNDPLAPMAPPDDFGMPRSVVVVKEGA